jgi:type II secretory pathway pseudopilin PulG
MKARSAFTIVELVMILTVLGVVAYITVPKFRLMVYQSRESQTKSNLSDIRGAVAIYYSDNFGRYPSDEGTPETRLVTALVPQYMKSLPKVELTHVYPIKKNTVQDKFDDQGDWVYSTLNGFVAVNSHKQDTKGEAISSW